MVEADAAAIETDIDPFRTLAAAPMAMTAHVVYSAWDPDRCASLSPAIIADVIRGRIGFDGLLMSDDLGMKALNGDFGTRAVDVIARLLRDDEVLLVKRDSPALWELPGGGRDARDRRCG